MKTVNSLQKLDKIIDSYLKKKKTLKPILIWFKSNLILDNFKKKLLERHKDIQCVYDIPSNPSFHFTNSSSILYHRYINQMDEDCLKYCTDLTLKNNPVIYLANEYERKNRPSFLDDKFDEIDCQVKNVIILNHMFTGKYLNKNIGHEIINLFSDDEGRQYIYLCKDGKFTPDDRFVEHVIQVRRPDKTKGTLEIINIASELNEYEEDNEPPTYGKKSIYEIFKQNQAQQEKCITFKANLMRKPKKHLYIWEGKNPENSTMEGVNLKDFNPSQQMREYIYEELDENGKTVIGSNYSKLKCLIEGRLTQKHKLPRVDLDCDISSSPVEIYGVEGRELSYSDAFKYFIENYPDLFKRFCNNENIENIKVYREWNNIDLIIECDNQLCVIENKIFSDLNGIDGKQLSDYKNKIETAINDQESPFFSKTLKSYILLTPNHNNIKIDDEDWKIIKYKEIYDFLKEQDGEDVKNQEIKDFIKSLEPHTHEDYNFSVMQKRFVRAIKQLK